MGSSSASASAVSPPPGGGGGSAKRRSARHPGRQLLDHDRGLGYRYVAGADEAGRGCLAGPLVAAAVLIDLEAITDADERDLLTLNDSKRQTAASRAALYPVILRVAVKVHVVSRCASSIDRHGLHKSNLAALHESLAAVARPGCLCLSDGFSVAELRDDQRAVVKGDATSAAIAAASVIAKETRDRYMRRVDARLPGWGFGRHVGYASAEHRSAIQRLGVTPLHRLSFRSKSLQSRIDGV